MDLKVSGVLRSKAPRNWFYNHHYRALRPYYVAKTVILFHSIVDYDSSGAEGSVDGSIG
jgi:hypothetical protein